LQEKERLISVDWGAEDAQYYPVPVVISAYDREGLMRDIGATVADEHINIRNINVGTHNHIATFNLIMEVQSAAQLSRILSKLEHLANVIEARRLTT
jgi:GTP pyrophosphokinase